VPRGKCQVEQEAYDKIVSELTEEFELDSLADKILVERSAMYLVKIMRAEAYDASLGVTEKTPFWGYYITKLDKMLQRLFDDLAVARGKRKKLDKGEALLVSIDEVMQKLSQHKPTPDDSEVQGRGEVQMRKRLCANWNREYPKLATAVRRRKGNGK
jgi:hypothetical protein